MPTHLTSPLLEPHHPAITHCFFTRRGGVSEGIYQGLNVGRGSHDVPERVERNWEIVAESLNTQKSACCQLYQIHSSDVLTVTEPFGDARPKADAMVTKEKGIMLGVLTADCVPVLFADPVHRVIGAAHSGWKGAVSGVLQNTVKAMEALGAQRQNILAAIGPCIHQASYEVGQEFYENFIVESSENDRFFIPSHRPAHYRFDLPGYVHFQLGMLELGGIDQIPYDTCTEEALFFSYRRKTLRGEEDYGRQVSGIVLK
jgi:YfiH family protein